jgi:predicted RNA binding protein YcfA (HicA-like mRNA interferase family)
LIFAVSTMRFKFAPSPTPQFGQCCLSMSRRFFGVYHTHVSSADLISELKKAGWQLARVKGSHHVFTHPQRMGLVVVPHPKKDLGKGLVEAIRQQAGI